MATIVMMYTGLVHVWAALCNLNEMPIHKVFGKKRVYFLIGTNVLLCLFMLPFPFARISNVPYELFLVTVNSLMSIVIFVFIILVTVYGYRVYK